MSPSSASWWLNLANHIAADLVNLRQRIITTFETALRPVGLLDQFSVSGTVAAWWGSSLPDLKALATLGYKGLVEAWVSTVLDALEEEKAKINPLDHKVAVALLPEYLDGLAGLEAEAAQLDSSIKAATGSSDGDDDESELDEDTLPPAELKQLKTKLTAVKRKLKSDKANFARHLSEASEALTRTAARQIVLEALQRDLLSECTDRVGRHRRVIVASFETWWEKYKTPFQHSAINATPPRPCSRGY
jgi:type I restriction enzyme M protein